MMNQIVEQMKIKEGVTEELKAKDQMKWVEVEDKEQSPREDKQHSQAGQQAIQ